ncbi:Cna B-type domain-containing protein [Salisediminibacterium beveridgei]|uniref:Collagen adhesin n=1 Tax=Salisediminibacterium beveridgei TaxID=632773 RepID=A0A1D7QYH4_9BACI|nr:Cna B-type domain-containing protein [Salisediminibacterium beveridgei]AOM84066.1 Collagen adhesin [Salisediminibacterium beveridgei]
MKNKSLLVLLTFVLLFQTLTSGMFLAGDVTNEKDDSVFTDVHIINEDGETPDPDPGESEDVNVTLEWDTETVDLTEEYEESFELSEELLIDETITGELLTSNAQDEEKSIGTYEVTEEGKLTATFHAFEEDDEKNTKESDNDSGSEEETQESTEKETKEESEDIEEQEKTGESSEDQIEQDEETKEKEETNEQNNEEQTQAYYQGTISFEAVYTKAAEEETEVESTEQTEEADAAEKEANDQNEEKEESASSSTEETGSFETLNADNKITENIITNITVKKDGETLEDGTELTLEQPFSGTSLELIYDFKLQDGHGYGDGATYTINVPEMFTIPQIPESAAMELARGDGTVFGEFYTSGNDIIIVFNETIAQESNISGNIELTATFDDDYDGPAEGDSIVLPFGEDESLEFPISFKPDENGLDKQGIGNRGYNTETITWTVDVNKNLQGINDAELTDAITKGQHSFDEDSFKIYELDMNADGSFEEPPVEVTEEKLNNGFTLDVRDEDFTLAMGDIDSAYRIVYETQVNDRVGEEYKNGAILTGADDLELETDATVAVTRGVPLAKEATGYDDVSQTIDWEVKYNYDEKEISQEEAKLTDVFGDANQTLNEDSFEVFLVSIDPDTGEETGEVLYTDYSLTVTENGYVVEFDEEISDAFKIRYQTNTIDRVDEDGNVTNEISDEFDNTSEGSQSIGQGILIKNNTDADYQEKTTDWSVTINRDEQLMQNTVFVDTLPDGFTFDQDSLSISGYSGDYDAAYNAENNEVTVTFNDDITERVTISYKTDIDYNLVDRDSNGRIQSGYSNDALVEWIPEGEENTVSKTGSATFNPDEYTKNNGFKFGSYNVADKEITWTIGVNYNEEDLDNVIVNDPISGNQNFDIENVAIYKMKMTPGANDFELGDEVTDTDEVTITSKTDPAGFNVSFGDISEGFVIVFTTDFEGQTVEEKYENTATVESDNREEATLEASVSPRFGGEFSTKQGRQSSENGRIVNWTVNVNFSQSEIENLVIEDTPSINQTILQDTLTIYETTATEDDINKNEGSVLTEGTDYEVIYSEDEDGQESYEISFIDEKSTIDRAYVLEYDTYILYEGDGRIANDLSISGEQVAEDEGGSSVNEAISFNNISGSITGEVGALEITKVDAEENDTLLEGAEFHLYDESGDVLIRTGKTDENGELTFVNLLYGEYQVVEVNAPEGYAIDRTVGDTRTAEVNEGVTGITVENYEIKRDVQLTKVDGTTDETLEGVEFELFDAGDQWIGSFTTDADGEIYVEDLEPGDYYFEETQPAEHYQENANQYPFTIIDEHIILDIEAGALTVENELIPGSAFMEKIDADRVSGDNRLQGATFRIVNIDEDPEIDFERTVTSGVDGLIETGDLRPGTYTIEEVSPPDGFELSDENEPIEFEIGLSQEEPIEIRSEPFENNVKTTSVEITKTDSINGQLLEDTEFELTYSDGDYDLDPSPQTGITDENGVVTFDDLKPGTYEIKELKAPEGYIASEDPVEVTVTLGDVHNERTVGVNVENDPFANLTLTKVDSETSAPLADAVFALEDSNGNEIEGFDELTTDSNGYISITGLPAGDYQFREVTPPDGYTIQEGGFVSHILTVDDEVTETEVLDVGNVDNDIIKGSVRLVKADGESNERLENVEFTLNAVDLVNDGTYSETSHTTDSNGEIIVEDLRPGKYEFEEVAPLDGYQPHWGNIEFELNFPHDEEQVEIDVANYELVSIDVDKQWNDDGNESNRPDEVTVELLQNGSSIGIRTELTQENSWNYTFEELDAVDSNGDFYEYTVEEVNPGEGYQIQGTIEGTQEAGFTITNVETRDLSAEKIWLDDSDRLGERPDEVEFQLQRDGDPLGEPVEVSGPEWEHEFTDLPVYDPDGDEYDYTVEETSLVDNYEFVEVNGDQDSGYDIVNRLTGNVDIPVTKEWNDTEDSADRPANIVVEVYQKLYDETDYPEDAFDTMVISPDSEGNWDGEFSGLPEFDEQGREFNYEVVEVPVDGYDSSVTSEEDQITITNTRSGEVAIEGEKSWQDDNEGDRPDSIMVNLLQNQAVIDSVEVTADDDWTYSFTELPEFDENGEAYEYAITEHDVPGYAVEIDGYDITNTRSEQRDIEVTKGWLDDNNPDRPEDITVTLLANGEAYETVNVTEEDGWVYVFEDLETYDEQGQAISYSVEEEAIDGYETQIDGFNINNLRSETMSLDVDKNWLDDDNATDVRPDFIVVELFRSDDPDASIDTKVIRASDDWTHTFTDLEKFDEQGAEYSYDIAELPVAGYEVTQSQTDSGFELTNLREGSISIDVTKEWNDGSAFDERPEEITVNLFRSDDTETPYDSAVIKEDDGLWTYAFEDLDQFDDQGVEYHYTVEEEPVANYHAEPVTGTMSDGFELTNTLQTDVAVEKSWLDTEETEDRPDAITVDLLRNGEHYDEVVLDGDVNWQAVFENLSKYDPEGQLYEYTVMERDLSESYVLESIAGDAEEGYTITNLRTGEVAVEGEKSWQDDNESDRPDSITVNLLQNQSVIDSVEVTEDDDWIYSFTELPEFDENGETYEYAITEHDVPGYAVEIDGYDITNTRSEQRDIEVTKGWLDDDNPDRPEDITVILLANGEAYETVNVTEEDGWVYVFEDLEAYDEQGQAISYSVEEEAIEGYETQIDGFSITNLRVGETAVTGTKTWVNDNQDVRPDSIDVQLYQNGELYEQIPVSTNDDWTFEFNHLPEFDEQGVRYDYSIQEIDVPDYSGEVSGYDLINTYEPEKPVIEEPDEPEEEKEQPSEEKGGTLPSTATNLFMYLLAGGLFILTGVTLLFINRRKQRKV